MLMRIMMLTALLLPSLLLAAAKPASAYHLDNAGGVPKLYQRSYGATGGYQSNGMRTPRSRNKCPRERSLLAAFDQSVLTCGSSSWVFPGLINGDCPIRACVFKFKTNSSSPFGGMDF
jgi:hypothetical protein